jgi:hypothetical protein
MKPEDLPAIIVFDAQDNTCHDLGDLARDRWLGSRRMTLHVFERPAMEKRRYLFAQSCRARGCDLSRCQILAYQGRAISGWVGDEAATYRFWFARHSFGVIKLSVRGPLGDVLRFQQHRAFPDLSHYNRQRQYFLREMLVWDRELPFPDMRGADPRVAARVLLPIREWGKLAACRHCGAVILRGLSESLCCRDLEATVARQPPPDMPEDLVQRVAAQTTRNANFPRSLNWRLRPVLQYSTVYLRLTLCRLLLRPVPHSHLRRVLSMGEYGAAGGK